VSGTSERFKIGELVTGERAGETCQAVILDKNDDTNELLVLWLSEQKCGEIKASELDGWARGPVPDARWVEVYKSDSEEPFFEGYLPTLQAALAVLKTFQEREGDFRVEIFTASEYEDGLVEEVRDPASARGYS
jgi:hypothetical protein